uniref:Cryptide Pep-12 n=2 Tax=Tityus TaxID=6886 RepID=CRY12_TITOB
ILTGKLKCK